jgi:hypothetical protein
MSGFGITFMTINGRENRVKESFYLRSTINVPLKNKKVPYYKFISRRIVFQV